MLLFGSPTTTPVATLVRSIGRLRWTFRGFSRTLFGSFRAIQVIDLARFISTVRGIDLAVIDVRLLFIDIDVAVDIDRIVTPIDTVSIAATAIAVPSVISGRAIASRNSLKAKQLLSISVIRRSQ